MDTALLSLISNPFVISSDTIKIRDDVHYDKYIQPDDKDWNGLQERVAQASFPDEDNELAYRIRYLQLLQMGVASPAGRILAGIGTSKSVTASNCFISPLLQDSMRTMPDQPGKGIMDALADVAYTMQAGGGVGTDFSPIRPKGALVKKLNAEASGPLAFMDMWSAMCQTVMSAGSRRGAMMATLMCDHPDIEDFVTAKHDPTRLRMFNVSVLVTDELITAIENDDDWELGHWEPPMSKSLIKQRVKYDPRSRLNRIWYIYKTIKARDLWNKIMRSTYDHAEPGIIFISRVNHYNNLSYIEYVSAANPCAEQCMSPDNACNLAHINLSKCGKGTPFTDDFEVDVDLIRGATEIGIRASDNVIDITSYPTEAQRQAGLDKRRIGFGITGLANLLMFCRIRYGSPDAITLTSRIMECIRDTAYLTSIELAREKGCFPAFDRAKYVEGNFIKTLPDYIQSAIADYGIRNSLLLTIAPTGTTSIALDNCSSGLEPVYLAISQRNVLQSDNTYKSYHVEDQGFRVYANVLFNGNMAEALNSPLPDYMVTTEDLSTLDHLRMQSCIQLYVDNSISKTINVPADITFEDFVDVYKTAYDMGCKGCTTYRPNPESGRGAVLEAIKPKIDNSNIESYKSNIPVMRRRERPKSVLKGETHELHWATVDYPLFLTINDEQLEDGRKLPFEMFINSKDVNSQHWITALTRMITSIMRKSQSIDEMMFIVDELKQVWSAKGGEWQGQSFIPSELALIGITLEKHFHELLGVAPSVEPEPSLLTSTVINALRDLCPKCQQPRLIKSEGCTHCENCSWSNCS